MKPNREQVIEWARDAGLMQVRLSKALHEKEVELFERFAALAYAAGLECAAEVCDKEEQRILSKQSGRTDDPVDINLRMIACVLPDMAAAIRALKGEEL